MMFGLQRKGRLALAAATIAVGGARPRRLLRYGGGLGSEGGDGGDANLSITMLPKNLGNPYFDTSTSGAKRPPRSSAARSRRSARPRPAPPRRCSTSRPRLSRARAALIVSANDPEAICDALDEARDAGVKVVTFDCRHEPGVP